jgi:hypothetical protein
MTAAAATATEQNPVHSWSFLDRPDAEPDVPTLKEIYEGLRAHYDELAVTAAELQAAFDALKLPKKH